MSAVVSTPLDAKAKSAATSGRLFFLDLGGRPRTLGKY